MLALTLGVSFGVILVTPLVTKSTLSHQQPILIEGGQSDRLILWRSVMFTSLEPEQTTSSRRGVFLWRRALMIGGTFLAASLIWQWIGRLINRRKAEKPHLIPHSSTRSPLDASNPKTVTLNSPPADYALIQWLFDQGSNGVAVCHPDGRIVLGNPKLVQLFGNPAINPAINPDKTTLKSAVASSSVVGAQLGEWCLRLTDRDQLSQTFEQAKSDVWTVGGGYFRDRTGEPRWFDWQVRTMTPQAQEVILTRMQTGARWDHLRTVPRHRWPTPRLTEWGDRAAQGASEHSYPQEPQDFSDLYVWVGWDNTEKQREREAIKLHSQLLQANLMAHSEKEVIASTLQCLCECLPWAYAEAWIIHSAPPENTANLHDAGLSISDLLCHFSPEQADKLIVKYCHHFFAKKAPKPESSAAILNAVRSGKACYLPALDGLQMAEFSRCNLALASGFNACLIVPIESNALQLVCLLFATQDSAEVAQAATLITDLIPQMNQLFDPYTRSLPSISVGDSKRPEFENTVEGLFRLSTTGYYVHANVALARIFGYDTPEALIAADIPICDQFVTESRGTKFERHLQTGSPIDNFTAELYRRDGTTIWIEAVVRVMLDDQGQICGHEGSMIDITDRQRTEDKLRYGATHDDLTGLWNRAWFVDQLQRILKRARRYDRYTFAVLFIDLDNFKLINDTLGHMVGDRLLVALAQRLNGALQQGQSLARLGGDEFTLCIDRVSTEAEVIAIAQTLCQQLKTPFQIGLHQLTACASIGIVIGSRQYEIPEMVLKDADIAMYTAKAQGHLGRADESRYVLFDLEMGNASQRRLRLEDDLRRAIEYDELSLHYQPIVDLKVMQTIGFEVLLRWQHPYYGAISPAEFIPLAEKSGAIVKLGEWVLIQACQQLQAWKRNGLETGTLSLSVNVSSRQLSSGLIAQIDHALHTYEIQPGELKIEITETVVMSDLTQAKLVLKQIKERKIPILLDDFGTGYCSLNYLYEVPIDTLKIDRSFVRTIDERPDRRQVLDTIFRLAEGLGLKVIAEGVENLEQLHYLEHQQDCYGQGYLFSKPVPASIAWTLLGQVWPQLAV